MYVSRLFAEKQPWHDSFDSRQSVEKPNPITDSPLAKLIIARNTAHFHSAPYGKE